MMFKEIVRVISNNQLALDIYEAKLYAPKISSICKPGQFINIMPSDSWNNVMRRPMSIASSYKDTISIIYKIFGSGTKIMSEWKQNQAVDVIGPLGNFWSGYEEKMPVLIGGGVGIAPILFLHDNLNTLNIQHITIVGAKNEKEHFLEHNPSKDIYLSTDMGGNGVKGNVIDVLNDLALSNNTVKIFGCGPHGMMNAIIDYSNKNNIDCDLALETVMACGIGICQGCTIVKSTSAKNHSYRDKYALACEDGPIFNIKELNDVYC